MSVERETVRVIASVLRGAVALPDGPTYIHVANACRKALEERGLLIDQAAHAAIWQDGVVTLIHPIECQPKPTECEMYIRAVDYQDTDPQPDGQYTVDWDPEEPYNLAWAPEDPNVIEGEIVAEVVV